MECLAPLRAALEDFLLEAHTFRGNTPSGKETKMDALGPKQPSANVNVTLRRFERIHNEFAGWEFPCPVCTAGLPLLVSKRGKPYCTCNDCGMQIFFRREKGISRLRRMARDGILISARDDSAARGIALLNRLERLKLQKRDLEKRRGIIFADENIENTISLIDAEMQTVQGELAKAARMKQKDRTK